MKRAELEALRDAALPIARDASDVVRAGFRKHPPVERKKARTDLVTEFDRASETLIRARLGAATPHPVIGEEEGGTWDPAAPTFFIDPLDGTTNFVHGHPFWCVSIGLVERGEAVLGVVVAPMLGLEWWGLVSEDAGAVAIRQRFGDPPEACAVSATTRLEDALLATGFPYDRRGPDNNFDAFFAIKMRCQAVRRCGSAAIDLCLVGDGTYDGYWEQKLKPWDIAGGSAVVRAAGGLVTDYDGAAATVTSGRAVAANATLHAALRAELDEVRRARTS